MKGLKEYLSRVGKSRGFGIQSPWAYSFVREVIYETCPYYAYAEIDRMVRSSSERKWARLHFRVANFVRPMQCIELSMTECSIDDIAALFLSGTVGAIILRKVRECRDADQRLKEIKHADSVGTVFDLYDEVICFPPTNERPKQYYKLNF